MFLQPSELQVERGHTFWHCDSGRRNWTSCKQRDQHHHRPRLRQVGRPSLEGSKRSPTSWLLVACGDSTKLSRNVQTKWSVIDCDPRTQNSKLTVGSALCKCRKETVHSPRTHSHAEIFLVRVAEVFKLTLQCSWCALSAQHSSSRAHAMFRTLLDLPLTSSSQSTPTSSSLLLRSGSGLPVPLRKLDSCLADLSNSLRSRVLSPTLRWK